ncbi:MAG: molybdopterin-guanine dinucleotide biosynthesis protein MobB [Xanthomonadales bacterium]|nr:molybdopterin-guanine dinucleotide biosynthesis protein MobB [Xanthomonadales bacterium]
MKFKDLPEIPVICANVRAKPFPEDSTIAPGLGQEGDLIYGWVQASVAAPLRLLNQSLEILHIDSAQPVIAVLGSRDSSTHVCAEIPAGGINVNTEARLHWVGGESGLVGCLLSDNESNSALRPEHSAGFVCGGLIQDASGTNRNVEDFARQSVQPATADMKIPPGLIIAASSSEAGKTVLCSKLIQKLTARGLRVGAIKATGTGGGLDGVQYRQHGAVAVLDQIDAGLITTHGSAELLQQRIPRIYQRMAAAEVDLLITELGGDLVSANNPAFFTLEEIIHSVGLMIVIANDALAAHGIEQFCRNSLGFPTGRIRFMTSPFRNHDGMSRRFKKVGINRTYDPNNQADLDSLVAEVAAGLVN